MDLQNIKTIAGLIRKHIENTLSESERIQLDNWLGQSENNCRVFEQICREKFIEQSRTEELLFNAGDAYQRFRKTLPKKQIRTWRMWGKAAASVLILIGAGWVAWHKFSPQQTPETTAITAGSKVARLVLAGGKTLELRGEMQDTLLYGGAQLYASGSHLKYVATETLSEPAFNSLEIPRKGEFAMTLSDGTKVWLNSETTLRFPAVFSGKERRVFLEGEAYFEVQKDPEHPFIVDLGKSSIEVLGTSFNVHSYKNEPDSRTTLAQGRVKIRLDGAQLELAPGEQGIINGSQKTLEKRKVNVNLYTSWKDGRFIFRQENLEEIMNTMSRWYDINVFFTSEKAKKVIFSGNLERYDDFTQIIRMLSMTQMANFQIKGNNIFISEQ